MRMPFHERIDRAVGCGRTDAIGDVDGKKIAGLEKAIHRLAANVIGIDMPWPRPTELLDGGECSLADAARLGADERVLAIGFVPYRHDVDPIIGQHLKGSQLSLSLMRKTVAHSKRESLQFQHAVVLSSL